MLVSELMPISRVDPLGAARATSSLPMIVPPPARFSTTTGWPRNSASLGAITRAEKSVPPPGEVGTMRRTALDGVLCASAPFDATVHTMGVQMTPRAIFTLAEPRRGITLLR
jgi:hypothetical protein